MFTCIPRAFQCKFISKILSLCVHEKLMKWLINSLPNDTILDINKLKAYADDKINVAQMMTSVSDRIENIVEKGEMLVTIIFFFSHNVLKRLFSWSLNPDCVVKS